MTLHTLFYDDNLNYNAIKEVLENGFDVNQQDKDGDTSLHLLMSRNDDEPIIDVCILLLEKGANINISNNDGNTPLHLAIMEDQHTYLIQLLLTAGANVNVKNNSNKTPLTLSYDYISDYSIITLLQSKHHNVLDEPWFQTMQQDQLDSNLNEDKEIMMIVGYSGTD